jgi:hypothetical protein
MKRRNFILGLGTITTISSGAAVTGAALANSVTPTSDFRAIAEANLTVRQGDGYDSTASDYSGSALDFSNMTTDDTPVAYVDSNTDGDLTFETAVEADSSVNHTFTGIIKVENTGDTTESVGITWEQFGTDTTGSVSSQGGTVDESNVESMYTFYADSSGDGTRSTEISPTTNSGSPANTISVGPGESLNIDLTVNPDSATVGQIQSAADVSGNPWSSAYDDVNLVNSINVGSE